MARRSYFLSRPRKRQQKIVFWILVVALGVGLVGSSVVWSTARTPLPQGTTAPEAGTRESLADLEARVRDNPGDLEAVQTLAEAYAAGGRWQEAADLYQRLLQAAPDRHQVRLELALVLYQLGRASEAAEQARRAVEAAPEVPLGHYYYGIILADGLKDYRGGVAQLEEFIRLAGQGPEVEKARQMIEEWRSKG
ncbi:MAG: tetratricopeptide repeat protein [Firmicutes bacterium]|nr:tetratricopeptide repeat protein [Bacillota bacterium]